MGGTLVFIKCNSLFNRLAVALKLLDAALVLLAFGDMEIVIAGATQKPNSVYTDAGVRITIDIVDVVFVALSSLLLVIWNTGYQYNKINMLDNCRRAMSALWRGNQVSASGRLGEVANGRIGAFQLANCGFGGQPGSEKCDWLDWVGSWLTFLMKAGICRHQRLSAR